MKTERKTNRPVTGLELNRPDIRFVSVQMGEKSYDNTAKSPHISNCRIGCRSRCVDSGKRIGKVH